RRTKAAGPALGRSNTGTGSNVPELDQLLLCAGDGLRSIRSKLAGVDLFRVDSELDGDHASRSTRSMRTFTGRDRPHEPKDTLDHLVEGSAGVDLVPGGI